MLDAVLALLLPIAIGFALLVLAGGDPLFMFRKIVYLRLYDGEILRTRLYVRDGRSYSYYSAATKVGLVELNDDGTCICRKRNGIFYGQAGIYDAWSFKRSELVD